VKLRLSKDEYLFRQNDPPTSAFLIEEGRVQIVLERIDAGRMGVERVLATRGPGDIVGEMAIIDHAPRSASVRALEDCVILPITADQLDRRMASANPIVRMVLNVILNRFRATLSGLESADGAPTASFFLHDQRLVDAAADELRLERDLDYALEREEIIPYYQPIVRLCDGALTGFEALARWNHPSRGFIPPTTFVPALEACGKSGELALTCMRHIAHDLPLMLRSALSNAANVEGLKINLNVSGHDLGDTRLIDQLADIADQAGLPTHFVHLELTESSLVRNAHRTTGALSAARERGFGVAIDDFGTGYSTMLSVQSTPATTLKIDRSFVQGVGDGGINLPLVENMLQLASSLGMNVVAEGIESAADANALIDLGCDFGQGYAFGRPQPIEHSVVLVRRWQRADIAAWKRRMGDTTVSAA
jgi:EAL domain-containing protein (putative c-di-GMP-specific phosphodiesterase class I)